MSHPLLQPAVVKLDTCSLRRRTGNWSGYECRGEAAIGGELVFLGRAAPGAELQWRVMPKPIASWSDEDRQMTELSKEDVGELFGLVFE